jgi:hypothetical protein
MAIKYPNIFNLQNLPKMIFVLKICHLATLLCSSAESRPRSQFYLRINFGRKKFPGEF